MPSNTLDDLIPSAVAAHSRATDAAGTQTIFVAETTELIVEAVDDGLFTVNVPIGSTTSKDLQWTMEQLRLNGYTVSIVSTNLVVAW